MYYYLEHNKSLKHTQIQTKLTIRNPDISGIQIPTVFGYVNNLYFVVIKQLFKSNWAPQVDVL